MNGELARSAAFFSLLVGEFANFEDELNALDAATGDGDHGATLLKGLQALENAPDTPATKTFRQAAGGASGSLFAQVMGAFDAVLNENTPLGSALEKAAQRVSQLGAAQPGDKTFLDALIPAAQAALSNRDNSAEAALVAAKAARAGMEATRAMTAKRGRAKYVEGAGVGHLDAGAVSVSRMLDLLARFQSESEEETSA